MEPSPEPKRTSLADLFPTAPTLVVPPAFGRWSPVSPDVGILSHVSDGLARLDLARPTFLPDLRQAPDLLAVSDYSGEHPGARYDVLSCLVADPGSLAEWDLARQQVRTKWLGDGRRVAFKSLGDRNRRRALPTFLDAAERLRGVVLTVAVDKRVGPLFVRPDVPRAPICARWKDAILEKVLRSTHLVSLMLAGLSRPAQNVLWITDEDAIAATHSHLRDLTTALAYVSSGYLRHDLGHLRCSTTSIQNDPSRLVEDLASIADLAAGTYATYLAALREHFSTAPDPRHASILQWFGAPVGSLARVFVTIGPDVGKRRRVEVSTLGRH